MCGIVGYIGRRHALPIILDGLKRLEYRGYDSSGVAIITDKGIKFCVHAYPPCYLMRNVKIAFCIWSLFSA